MAGSTQTDIDTTLAYPFHQKHICAIEMRIESCEAQREHESGFPFQS